MNLETILHDLENDERNQKFTLHQIHPILQVSPQAKVLIIGQAPGKKAEESSLPFFDRSGVTLRRWMNIDESVFYSPEIAIVPMDFYYPGKGKTGDLPPRRFIAEEYHEKLLSLMPSIHLTILIGSYSQVYYLKERRRENLTETVLHFQDYLPNYFPIVHPSPLNFRWLTKNPWFEKEAVPALQKAVASALAK